MYKEKKQNWYINPRKYHFIYKTTCNVNGKYYLGMHSTDNLDDGYIGSGTRLWHSIRKHRRESFKLEILEFLPDRESLKKRETEVVNKEILKDSLCMNLTCGGYGGWYAANKVSPEQKSNAAKKAWQLNPEMRTTIGQSSSSKLKARYSSDEAYRIKMKEVWTNAGKTAFAGKSHSIETRAKIGQTVKLKQTGSLNSQFGSKWITNGIMNQKTKDESLLEGWRFGRVKKRENRSHGADTVLKTVPLVMNG